MPSFLPENDSNNVPVHDLVYDRLIDVDATGKVHPAMAKSVEKAADGTWTLTLNPGIKFSDGTPLNAQAIATYWDLISRDKANLCNTALAATATAWKVVDDVTLSITPAPSAGSTFLDHLDGNLPGGSGNLGCVQTIGSPTARAAEGADFARKPVGAGPFTLKEWVQGDHMVFVKNPSYWQKGKPNLDEIDVKLITDVQQLCQTFISGGYQGILMGTVQPCLKDVTDAGFQVVKPTLIGGIGFQFGLNKAPTDDVRVRKALALAVDPEDLNQKAVNGQTSPVDHFFPKDSPFYVDVKNPLNDLTQAQKLIDEYVAEKGGPVVVDFVSPNPVKVYSDVLIQQLSRLKNVQLKVRVLDGPAISKSLTDKDYNVSFVQYAGFSPDGALGPFKTNANATSQYSNPQVDTLLTQAAQETDVAKKKDAYTAILTQLNTDIPGVAIWRADRPVAIDQKVVKDWELRPGSLLGPYFENVWLSK
jgi:peptide/nickel transport system substrate-binding protein